MMKKMVVMMMMMMMMIMITIMTRRISLQSKHERKKWITEEQDCRKI